MSKQLLIEYQTFQPIQKSINEAKKQLNGNMIVSGLVQACDRPNANKRIYPYQTLKSQVDKYILGPIAENRALGELDHPECHRPSAQILTIDGWKFIKDVSIGESVMTLNTKTNLYEWNNVERVINEPYKGKAYKFLSEDLDIVVTPNHKFILKNNNDSYEEFTAEELYNSKNKYSQYTIPKLILENHEIIDYQYITIDTNFLKIEEIEYNDTIHCVTVKNGNFYCKDQDLSFLSGNSSIINLKNVSHNIVKLWWDGKDLFGEIEILPTPSGNILKQLFQNNITVGISSRAMGSTTPIGEGLVQVEEDLDLICWDFVSQPSTFGAYVKPIGSLSEGVNKQHIDEANKLHKIISDIICTQSGVCCIK